MHYFIQKMKNFMITSALLTVSTVTMALSYAPAANAFGVGIQPSTVEMTIKPGDRHRQVVTIGNVHKTKTISLTMGLADWSLDKTGQLILNPPGETDRSAADWIRFSPASVTLKPGTSQDIIVEISVPYKMAASGDHRFALLATTMLPELDERGDVSGVWNRYQLASLFYLTLTPSKSMPVVSNVILGGADNSLLTMTISNEGDAHARLKGNAVIKDQSGETVVETGLSTVVLNESVRTYDVKLAQMDQLISGENYTIEFDFKNSFAPQNKFRAMDVIIQPYGFVAP